MSGMHHQYCLVASNRTKERRDRHQKVRECGKQVDYQVPVPVEVYGAMW